MSSPPAGGTEKALLDDELLVLTITTDTFLKNKTGQKQEAWEKYDEPTEQETNPYHPEL